jgi:hypothetical protein
MQATIFDAIRTADRVITATAARAKYVKGQL